MKRYSDEFSLDFKSYDQLSYEDDGQSAYVKVYLDDEPVAFCKVYNDRENESREYICINYEILYLDTLKQINKYF
jgi:hypothetical protein